MAKTVTILPEELSARAYADRLILEQLTEMESAVKLSELADRLSSEGLGLATVRSLLASNPERFAYHERRWIPASRIDGVGRPFTEAVSLIVGRFGGPMSIDHVVLEVSRIRGLGIEDVEYTVRRMLDVEGTFILLKNDRVALSRWSFRATDELFDRAIRLNSLEQTDVDELQAKLQGINWRDESSIADALKIAAPVNVKLLGAVAYQNLNSEDPKSYLVYESSDFFRAVLNVPGYAFGSDGMIVAESESKKWINTAIKMADKLAPLVDVDDAAPIEIKAGDSDRLIERVISSEGTVTALKLLEEFYEITPSHKTFPDDLANIMAALKGDSRVQWVGGDRFRKAGDVAEGIDEVPEPFQFVATTVEDEEGELVDVELIDDGLSTSLRKLLQHPLATDVSDEDIQPAPKTMPEQVRLVLKSIHRELGTFPLSQFPTSWLDAEPKIQEVILHDPAGRELQVWVNQEARLVFGFLDWWLEQPIESGAVFTLTKTTRANVFEFAFMDQPDPVVYISSARMEELRTIGVESEGKSTLDVLIQAMAHWPKGADYLTLLAEVNVVRRCTRRLIASLLSSYQCFYQRSGSPVWHFDAKKVEQGFDKTKRKFVKK